MSDQTNKIKLKCDLCGKILGELEEDVYPLPDDPFVGCELLCGDCFDKRMKENQNV